MTQDAQLPKFVVVEEKDSDRSFAGRVNTYLDKGYKIAASGQSQTRAHNDYIHTFYWAHLVLLSTPDS